MRGCLVHAITSRWNFDNVFGFCSIRVRLPDMSFVTFLTFIILARFSLLVFGVLQSVVTVWNSYVVDIKGEFFAFSEMQNTLMGSSPIRAEVSLILIMPY